MAATAATGEWAARMQKRRDFELTFLRRPSETESHSLSESTHSSSATTTITTTTSPASPESTHSAKTSTSFDQVHALRLQLQRNAVQIEANEARMRELEGKDTRMGADLQERLSSVSEVNRELSLLREMLARAERVSRGEFGVGFDS
ncbi:hypothetical protein M409DRAFT_24251 [Zasmidium cellare ATCC 36951]|uniref:Uncharacterized protein n=1 Tax=Zasmidium cellare ATCC 36951 TaxID=1080233 RepID=A0A6A6CE93_ZASCE|nr:uncharacterized protein M409DRAFT_24251 [Zasmidium cellare ATCC 36951]KAF2165401.1 hypothetical protein M409DRAFT_24251 [Zasmidium cellare ATCC 36951]